MATPASPTSPTRKPTRRSTRQPTLDLAGNRPGKSIFLNPIAPPTPSILANKIGPPSHRHGTPSGPWPFMDIDDNVQVDTGVNAALGPGSCPHIRSSSPDAMSMSGHSHTPHTPHTLYPVAEDEPTDLPDDPPDYCWCQYPQSLFPNWTAQQRRKSRITRLVEKNYGLSRIFQLDVKHDGHFVLQNTWEVEEPSPHFEGQNSCPSDWWDSLHEMRPSETYVRAMFIDNMTGPVLQILGTKFNVEPFFFSSSLGWIPSRYRESVVPGKGDHITVTLTFLRSMPNPDVTVPPSPETANEGEDEEPEDVVINTQAPLQLLSSNLVLVPDLFSLHLVRAPTTESSTIISYHHADYLYKSEFASAYALRNRLFSTGRSVYWSNIFRTSKDPTFVFLSLLWYPLYAWDEALENLYSHLCTLEAKVIVTNDMQMTQELHLIRAHLLHYESLLIDFKKAVSFVQVTPYPALDDPKQFSVDERNYSMGLMMSECESLLREISRLEMSREGMDKRLKNVMDLAFSSVNLEDSRRMQKLTEASVRDAAAMKQIAYLSMVFLPSTFVATVFGMNVDEINPGSNENLRNYFAAAIPLTVLTIWIVVATQIQVKKPKHHPVPEKGVKPEKEVKDGDSLPSGKEDFYVTVEAANSDEAFRKLGVWTRLWWPVVLLSTMFEKRKERRKKFGYLDGGAVP